jgi:uncharacterized protein
MSMRFPKIEIDENAITSLAKKYQIREMAFFGSVLREDFNDQSDIDILIKFYDNNNYSLFDLFKMKEDFEEVLGKEVDIIEKDGLKNPYRREAILKNAKVVYAA